MRILSVYANRRCLVGDTDVYIPPIHPGFPGTA